MDHSVAVITQAENSSSQNVAEHDNATGAGEFHSDNPLTLQMQGSPGASSLLTPDQKFGPNKSEKVFAFDSSASSGSGSSDDSAKEGSELSLLSSSDSDSESYYSCPVKPNDKMLNHVDELLGMEGSVRVKHHKPANDVPGVREIGNYDTLLRRIVKYDEEFKSPDQKIWLSVKEVDMLRGLLEKNKSFEANLCNKEIQLEAAKGEIKLRESDIELEKKKVLQLQMQVTLLEAKLLESSCKTGGLEKELEVTREKLESSEREHTKLKEDISNEISELTRQLHHELESTKKDVFLLEAKHDAERRQVLELQQRIVTYTSDIADRDGEIEKLNVAMRDTLDKFSAEKAQLQSRIFVLSENLTFLEGRSVEWDMLCESLENEIKQSRAEKMEIMNWYETQETSWRAETECLKAELRERDDLIMSLRKEHDSLKLKYDALMTDNNELRLRIEELKTEVDEQKVLMLDRAEEKREAIRQLCYSLEHYRSGYEELRQAFIGRKRRIVMAV